MHARRAVENTGITDDEVVRQMSIGSAFLDLPLDEKRKHPCNFAEGNFFGYREGVRIMGDSGVVDNSEACVLVLSSSASPVGAVWSRADAQLLQTVPPQGDAVARARVARRVRLAAAVQARDRGVPAQGARARPRPTPAAFRLAPRASRRLLLCGASSLLLYLRTAPSSAAQSRLRSRLTRLVSLAAARLGPPERGSPALREHLELRFLSAPFPREEPADAGLPLADALHAKSARGR